MHATSTIGARERILQLGEARLSDAECLALVLRTGGRGEPVDQLAQRLLRQWGGLGGLAQASVRELASGARGGDRQVGGLGPVRAASVAAAFGLARRLGEAEFRPGRRVQHGGDVARVVRDTARGSRRENFFAVLLDVRRRVMALHVVSTGIVDMAPVHPREVFSAAVRDGAAAVVVAHNHPSGDPTPSPEDRRVTERLRASGDLLGIEVLDHLVVGADRYYSFADEAFFPYSPDSPGNDGRPGSPLA